MKNLFYKILSVGLSLIFIFGILQVPVSAAGPYTVTLAAGIRGLGGVTAKRVYGEFNDKFEAMSASAVEKIVQSDESVFCYTGTITAPFAGTLAEGDTYYEFTYTDANDVVYTFTYTIDSEGNKANQAVTFQTDADGNFKWPEAFFKMPGYGEQSAWSTGVSIINNATAAKTGATKKIAADKKYYAFYPPIISLAGGTRKLNGLRVYGEFNAKIEALSSSAVAKAVQKNQYVFAYDTSGSLPKDGQLEEGATYYEFNYTDESGIEYTFTYTLKEKLDYDGNTLLDEAGNPILEKFNQAVFFRTDEIGTYKYPEVFFTLTGYGEQNKWSPSITSNGSYNPGAKKTATKDVIQGASYPAPQTYTITYNPGSAEGVAGDEVIDSLTYTYGRKITLSDAVFTRPGYIQVGWATEDNVNAGDTEKTIYNLSYVDYTVFNDTVFYPVWEEERYGITYDVGDFDFGTVNDCYSSIEPQYVTITNTGNVPLNLTLPTSEAYDISISSGSIPLTSNETLALQISPKTALLAGDYSEIIPLDFGTEKVSLSLNLKFNVLLGHNVVIVKGYEPTCIEYGRTDKSYCSFCGETLVEQKFIEPLGHTYDDNGIVFTESTCTQTGVLVHNCTVCNYADYTDIPLKEHTPVIDAAVEPTETTAGLTEGSHCAVCGKVIKKQTEIAPLGDIIALDTLTVLTRYNDRLTFTATGDIVSYQWYACNNSDCSDAVTVRGEITDSFSPMHFYSSYGQQNKYTYFYCIATVYQNGTTQNIKSSMCINAFSLFDSTEKSYIDYENKMIFTDSISNINSTADIIEINEQLMADVSNNDNQNEPQIDFKWTPSQQNGDFACYGTGTTFTVSDNGSAQTVFTVIMYGDVNGDGVVDVLDNAQIAKAANNQSDIDGIYYNAGDIDEDGAITALDYQSAINKALM